jgi:hypothetical protein
MANASSRPVLRSLESIVVPDKRLGKVVVLRDTQGITDKHAVIPLPMVPIVGRFTGSRTCAQIAKDASRELGEEVPVDVVVRLADELDRGLFLEGASFEAAKKRVEEEFARAEVREASHAGGAYHGDPTKLRSYLGSQCLAKGRPNGEKRIVGLVAPHIDPWRGAECYGHAYATLRAALPEDVDTFLVLGTSHAFMRRPFALCRKAFDTPLGRVEADLEAIDQLADAADFDPYADQFNHKREHSIEFQVVFLKYLLGDRAFKIVPVLASMGDHQARGTDPAGDAKTNGFLDAMRALVESRGGRAVVVAGADLAHVGPRFGDPRPYDAARREALDRADRTSLGLATSLDARGFWEHVAADLGTRRVCGLGPIYSLLRALPAGVKGRLVHYEQTVDAEDGSIVSHAAVGFFG